MQRANSRIPPVGGGGDYLDKDELIRDQQPMAIKSVNFDAHGSQFGPRWVVSIGPWFEDQDGPEGLLTFTNSPTRQPVFEDLQVQIEESGNQPIGPVILVKGKSQQGYRYYTFGDWSENGVEPAPVQVPVQQRPPAMRPMVVQPEPAPAPRAKRGRPAGSRNKPKETEETPVQAKPAERQVAGTQQQLNVGQAVCPNCNQIVTGRVLPDDQGRKFIIHPHCPATNKAEILPVSEEVN